MILKKIREGKFSKVIASYLAMQLLIQYSGVNQVFAITSGPTQPEFNSFTPIGSSDMVNLSTGDFNYNIPIMDVGGYPLNLSYTSGITVDQEASWVGLGWNMNIGQIGRQVRGLPDDFKGDKVRYENDMRDNVTVGVNLGFVPGFAGAENAVSANVGLGVQYNNYNGVSFRPSLGVGVSLGENVSVGVSLSSSVAEGATVSPSLTLSDKSDLNSKFQTVTTSGKLGIGLNSRKGLENMSLSASTKRSQLSIKSSVGFLGFKIESETMNKGSVGGAISLNDQSFTPTKRAGMKNTSYTFNAGTGGEYILLEGLGEITGYGTFQKIRSEEKNKLIEAYGYEHTEANEGKNGILDFNRVKDKHFNKNTLVLPVTNYTYDLYSVNGQGLNGMFRPYRSQTSYVYDHKIVDFGESSTLGVEAAVGNTAKVGVDFRVSPSYSKIDKWQDRNYALPKFKEYENETQLNKKYEPVYFKMVGELDVDNELDIYNDLLHANKPMKFKVTDGGKWHRNLESTFQVKQVNASGIVSHDNRNINTKIKRSKRLLRNQNIQKISNKEAAEDDFVKHREEDFSKAHHTVGIKILKPDGSTYVFGETAYNTTKVEATFDVSKRSDFDCQTGLVGYNGSVSGNHRNYSDKYLNRITTPGYAHTYALSSILSSDYEDRSGNGITDDDFGSYTKFSYTTVNDYKWRTPYQQNKASYNEGLKSQNIDQKGSYIYGEKELLYANHIETKTHVAKLEFDERRDATGVIDKNGGRGTTKMLKIKKIYLYSKPEYQKLMQTFGEGDTFEALSYEAKSKAAIKIAHFDYDYSQCRGEGGTTLMNNDGLPYINDDGVNTNLGGKLTLKKVYFTYRNSNMGKYTPYKFYYGELDTDNDGVTDLQVNPNYSIKGFDVWGNYKENITEPSCEVTAPLTNAEFPFVEQDKATADRNVIAWTLTSVNLPSGGKLALNYESDDYGYVQNKKAMQMFKFYGVGNSSDFNATNVNNNQLFNTSSHKKYAFIKISDETGLGLTADSFKQQYLGSHYDQPIYFRTLLNMVSGSSWQYDYVSGYFEIDQQKAIEIEEFSGTHNGTFVAIPMKFVDSETTLSSGSKVNPISKAGWYFGRSYLNRVVYGIGGDAYADDFESILLDLTGSLEGISNIFSGPNKALERKGCAKYLIPEKSWIRFQEPNQRKLGGGLRVTKVALYDNWDEMTSNISEGQFYGQEYSYTLANGNTSGVATYEPNSSRENPLIMPYYGKPGSNKDKLIAPGESNYTETPFGENFFPSPMVSYGRVTVKNISRIEEGTGRVVKKHATGKVVNEFYTSKDFPTLTDQTDITTKADTPRATIFSAVSSLLGLTVKNHLTMSQGFVIETNDMNGKMKSQKIYAEGRENPISRVDYNYALNEGKLENLLPTLNRKGQISTNNVIGMQYDNINDFRENYSDITSVGFNGNLAGFILGIFPGAVPLVLPAYSYNETILRTATNTKVIRKAGILKEKVAYDLGSRVSTENLVWDAHTGQVLLTKTINEYDDYYYNFTYPVHWYYNGMDKASQNIDLKGSLSVIEGDPYFSFENESNLSNYFKLGDELQLYYAEDEAYLAKYWVVGFNESDTGISLMNKSGQLLNSCGEPGDDYLFKIYRSGYRNQHTASMASVTSQVNPLDSNRDGLINENDTLRPEVFNDTDRADFNTFDVINASAIAYKELWKTQNENGLPDFIAAAYITDDLASRPSDFRFNPYLYNVLGEWRADKSFAYLTGRRDNTLDDAASPRREGFFTSFSPFYKIDDNETETLDDDQWVADNNNWTFASEVSEFSPHGVELENKDALNRYSAAQYGYDYTLPTAVASNSQYQEMGFDGFEDYESQTGILSKAFDHFAFQIRRADRPNVSALSPSYSDLLSHTGRYSVSVPSGEKVTMHKSLVEYRSNPRLNPSCADVTVIESGGCADDSENKSNAHSKTITIENTINSSITINLKATFFDEAHDCAENMKISVNNGTSLNVLSDGQSMNITIGVGETKTLTCISSVTATAGTGGYPKLNSALEFTGVDNSFNTTLTFIMCDDYYCYDPGDPSGF